MLVILPHDDDDAVSIANDSPYGLSGAVHGGDPERARAVARRLRTGTVSVNGGLWYGADVPFGGYKQSGIGREMGVAGFEEYLETKVAAALLPVCAPGTVIAIHSTIHFDTAVRPAGAARPYGVEVVDAPVSGGPMGAAAGTLAVMVGASEAAFARVKEAFGAREERPP